MALLGRRGGAGGDGARERASVRPAQRQGRRDRAAAAVQRQRRRVADATAWSSSISTIACCAGTGAMEVARGIRARPRRRPSSRRAVRTAVRRDAAGGAARVADRRRRCTACRSGRATATNARRCSSTLAVAPFQTAEGAQAGWILVLEDVTDRANLEEQLRLSEKMAAIGLLAAGVAHEVNTPLTGISSFTQMLLERSEPDDPQHAAAREDRAADVPRGEDRQQPAQPRAAVGRRRRGRSTSTASSATSSRCSSTSSRSATIQVRKDLAKPAVVVRGVEYKLQQVFLNLFLNARDAMPKGGWLSVATRAEGGDGGRRGRRHGRRHSRRAPRRASTIRSSRRSQRAAAPGSASR